MSRHPGWRHTVLFGDGCCLCSGDGVCRACRGGPPPPQMQPGFSATDWQGLVATRDPGDYLGRHRRNDDAPAMRCCGRLHAHSYHCINYRIHLLSTDNQGTMGEKSFSFGDFIIGTREGPT